MIQRMSLLVIALLLVELSHPVNANGGNKKEPNRRRQGSLSSTTKELRNITDLLDTLLLGYDYHLRPDFGGPPTEVLIDLHARSMGPIAEIDMSYSMDCYFRQSWKDSRLAYDPESYLGKPKNLALSVSMLDKIWKPDTYFFNGKKAYIHTITNPNKFVRIASDGMVLYSSRMTVKAGCPMRLERFPMDTQRCPLEVGSFGYSIRDFIYKWNPNRTVVIAPDMKMSQFDLTSSPAGNHTTEFGRGGPYSRLIISFHFKRLIGSFIIEVYAPGILLVILSWVSFWINREATADRISLGIMTVLTMTFLGLETRNDLPKVSYMTALDYFVTINFAMIFASIVQFAIVHYYTKIGSGEYYIPPPEILKRIEQARREASKEDEEYETEDTEGKDGDDEYTTEEEERKAGDQEPPQLQPIPRSPPVPTAHRQGSNDDEGGDQEVPTSVTNTNIVSKANGEINRNFIVGTGVVRGEVGIGRAVGGGGVTVSSRNRTTTTTNTTRIYPSSSLLMNALVDAATITMTSGVPSGYLSDGEEFVLTRTRGASSNTSFLNNNFPSYNLAGHNKTIGQHEQHRTVGQRSSTTTKSRRGRGQQQDDGFFRDFCPIHGEFVKKPSKTSSSTTQVRSSRENRSIKLIQQSMRGQQQHQNPSSTTTMMMNNTMSSQVVKFSPTTPTQPTISTATSGVGVDVSHETRPILRNRNSPAETANGHDGFSASRPQTAITSGMTGFNRFSNLRNSFLNYYSSNKKSTSKSRKPKHRRSSSRRKVEETILFQLNSVSQIDKFSRVFFPVIFIIINYIYWSTYLTDDDEVIDMITSSTAAMTVTTTSTTTTTLSS